ncbi:GFA family protein [Delftia acidovorans]|uniref:GFA family protein n=1 Tax=Delftia acidovorans TaxID=80866 RepID=UPI00406D13B2
MFKPTLPADGGCRCGKVRFRISAAPLLTMACHCRGCQRMSSSAYSLSAAIPASAFELTQGEPVIGGMHGEDRHYFCEHCMTWMFTRPGGIDAFVNCRATLLDETGWFSPFVETYTSTKLAFADTGAAHSFEKFPPMEAYEGLINDYVMASK